VTAFSRIRTGTRDRRLWSTFRFHHRQGISSSPAITRRITLIHLVVYVVTALTMLSEVKRHGAFGEQCIIHVFFFHSSNECVISTPNLIRIYSVLSRSRWPPSLRRGFVAARLPGLRVRIPPGAWMFLVKVVCC